MKNILKNNFFYKDLLGKVLVMFGAGYVALFGLEVVLPGVVTGVFNLNFMLLMFFVALVFLVTVPFGGKEVENSPDKIFFVFICCFVFYLSLILFFALYRVSIFESFWYLFLAFLALKGFFKMI